MGVHATHVRARARARVCALSMHVYGCWRVTQVRESGAACCFKNLDPPPLLKLVQKHCTKKRRTVCVRTYVCVYVCVRV